jgi:hypothetical protein
MTAAVQVTEEIAAKLIKARAERTPPGTTCVSVIKRHWSGVTRRRGGGLRDRALGHDKAGADHVSDRNDQTQEAREPHEHDAAAWAKHREAQRRTLVPTMPSQPVKLAT